MWDGRGAFVFTGSGGVYAHEDGRQVSERSETSPLGKDERTDRQGAHIGTISMVTKHLKRLPEQDGRFLVNEMGE